MPIPIGTGDIANRLRRAFGLTGRIPTALDETVVPVAIVRDSDQLPYSLDPASWEIGLEVTGLAANQSTIAISNQGDDRSIAMVDEIVLQVGTADERVELSRSGALQTAIAALGTKKASDFSTKCQGLATALDSAILGSWWNVNIVTVGSIGRIIRATLAPIVIPCSTVLRKNEVLYLKSLTNTIRVTVSARGRYWSQFVDS